MYLDYFHIEEYPFSLTPDPRFLFLSEHHREALAHLLYGMGEGGGFVLLTGEVGTGKTTLCRSMLEQAPEGVDVALILNPRQTATELVASICDELRIPYGRGGDSVKNLVDALNLHLLASHAKGRRTVVVIDEAQNLSVEVLEQVRLLTNLETTTHKLLQILLIGQPELQTMMARPEMRQLAQRVTARYHLTPLSAGETAAYVEHRLAVAGFTYPLFGRDALRQVHRLSGGVPRIINILCDRAMLGAYAHQRVRIDKTLVRKAATEIGGETGSRGHRPVTMGVATILLLVLFGCIGALWLRPGAQDFVAGGPRQALARALDTVSGWIGGKVPSPQSLDRETTQETSPPLDAPETAEGKAHVASALSSRAAGTDPDIGAGSLGELISSGTVKTDIETAFLTLFRHWQVPDGDFTAMTACKRAASEGLRCLQGRGDWTTLQHYNRPAVLELLDATGRPHHVVISGLKHEQMTLDFGGAQVTLPRTEMELFWPVDYTLFWRPPPTTNEVIGEGSIGPQVLWVRQRLDRVNGMSGDRQVSSTDVVFDSALRRRVVDFQRSRGLKPDGLVGVETFIQLNTVAEDPSIPVLWRPDV